MNTLREVLDAAERAHVAVGHFNFSDLVTLKAVATSAHELRVPVTVGVSEGERAFLGVRQAAAAVRSFREELGLPIFLNADHTHSLKNAEDAAPAGFDEIIFDRSELPIEKNANETRRAVEAIKSINPSILVEGEIGYIGTSSEVLDKIPEGMSALTTPEEATQFVTAAGVGKGQLRIVLDPTERHSALTVNEYETLLMRYDLAEVLKNPLRFAAQKAKHAWDDPRAVPSKTIAPRTIPLACTRRMPPSMKAPSYQRLQPSSGT